MATNYFPYVNKNSSLFGFKSISSNTFNSTAYGETLRGNDYPRTSSITTEYYYSVSSYNSERKRIYALKNTLNSYRYLSDHYSYSSSYWNKALQTINMVNIPSIFYGSSIDKGSLELAYYVSGTMIGKLQDINKNGELIQTTGSGGSGSVAGVVLYNEGIILLTGSWNIIDSFQETLVYNPSPITQYPKWTNWGAGLNIAINQTVSSSYTLTFDGINYVNTITMLAHAEKDELNHSNNPTYIKYNDNINYITTGSLNYNENEYINIYNTNKYPYENYTGSLERQVFITKVGIYDENKNLIAIAKVSKPIRKTENRNFTFKLKLDI